MHPTETAPVRLKFRLSRRFASLRANAAMPTPLLFDPFQTRDTFNTGSGTAGIYRLERLEKQGLGAVSKLPFSMRVLLEAVLRNCDGYLVTENDVRSLAAWNAASPA